MPIFVLKKSKTFASELFFLIEEDLGSLMPSKDGFFNLNDKVEILYDSLFFSEASYIKSLFPFNYGKNKNTIHLKQNIDLKLLKDSKKINFKIKKNLFIIAISITF